ncbi:MAG: esterase-like activity of phytase family protein [Paracoccaceae bacterium]
MRRRLALALGAVAALGLALSLTTQAGQPGKATYLGSYRWAMDDPAFGGLSSLAMLEGGTRLIAMSDSADLFQARVTRDASGRITAITAGRPQRLRAIAGEALTGKASDAEGLALDPQGGFFVSFEAQHRIRHYPAPDQPARRVPGHPDFAALQINSGLEALAIDARGHLFTLPERSGALDRPFPVYRYDGQGWDIPFRIPRSGPFLPVSADIGPDGWLYILERALTGPGFRSRLRRFDITGGRLNAEELLLQTRTRQHDNLEGLSVWQDGQGRIRLSMVSDDNFKFFQRSEIVEYALDAPLASLPDKE